MTNDLGRHEYIERRRPRYSVGTTDFLRSTLDYHMIGILGLRLKPESRPEIAQ